VPEASKRDLFTPAPLPQAPLDDTQRLACLRLIRSEQVGPSTFRDLINHFGGAEAALDALPGLAHRGGRRRPIELCPRNVAEAELAAASKVGARPLFTIEPGYPPALAHVEVPPPMLYVKGRSELLDRPSLAVVGSRNASAAGQRLARQLAATLGREGLAIVSGLARGIDAAAHEAALPTGTIAVVAGGIDCVYPPEHGALQERIAVEGCLVSEQPPGFVPRAQDFPRRNRIISGISLGVVIVEAARRSGSLITARQAGEQGREVMAVPGHPLDPRAEGTNQLLKDGATLVTGPDDVLAALGPILGGRTRDVGPQFRDSGNPSPTNPVQASSVNDVARKLVVDALGPAPVNVDELARATGLPISIVKVVLLELALAGRIEQHGSQLVSLRV
jgi:DNA processing protein